MRSVFLCSLLFSIFVHAADDPWRGQKTMDDSQPVAIASDQSAIPVSQNSPPWSISLPTNASTLTEQQTQSTHLSNIATSIGILDDWDESDRAKVNLIVGQAGVQGGSGSVSSNTQRVVLATDVALPTGTNSIGQVTTNAGTNTSTAALALETTQTSQNTLIGAVNETAPASDTASSGLNGRLQRIAQRITSLIALFSSTNTTPSLTDTTISVRPIPYEPQTYRASSVAFVPPSSATDVCTLTGSGTKTVRVLRAFISGTTTSGSAIKLTIQFVKRSSANSGGTAVAATTFPLDSNNAAATATVAHYTANPTLGTTVGVVKAVTSSVQSNGLTTNESYYEEHDSAQPVTLRGTAQQFSINLNGTTVTGPVFSCSWEWVEI